MSEERNKAKTLDKVDRFFLEAYGLIENIYLHRSGFVEMQDFINKYHEIAKIIRSQQ